MKTLTIYLIVMICLSGLITGLSVAANVLILSVFFAILTALLCIILWFATELFSTIEFIEQQESAEQTDVLESQFFNAQ